MLHALVLSDDTDRTVGLSDVFREAGFALQSVSTLKDARGALLRDMPDVALMDYELLGTEGLEFLETSRLGHVIDLVLFSREPELGTAVRGMQVGAADYISVPVDPDRLRKALERVAEGITQPAPDESETDRLPALGPMYGDSPPMRRLFRVLKKVAPTDMTVLLVGESGVGKELAAGVIHQLSHRSGRPLEVVNCGAINAEILESELFGHEKGSFTGATRSHRGFFERADGGTLFLDEITEMSPALQVKLLRVLESGRVRRVGGESDISIDVRVIAATNRDPERALESGALREDLYYRLAQFPVRVPALRERGEDILELARRFAEDLGDAQGLRKKLSNKTEEILRMHSWPGNVRELKNAVGRAYVVAGETIEPEDLPSTVVEGGPVDRDYLRIVIGQPLTEIERRAILATVEHFEGDKKAAARALGVSLKTIYTKLKKYRGESD
ncbi:MAG: sigma-54 dependent transcriptional regulator [Gammaproteobacteria bacterium]